MTFKEIRQPLEQKTKETIADKEPQHAGFGLMSTVLVARWVVLYGMGIAFIGGFVMGGFLVAFLLRAGGWK